MTETDIYKLFRPWVLEKGKILRVENTVSTGTADVIIFYSGKALLMELKVIRANKIKVRPFQMATAAEYTTLGVSDAQYNFVCSGDDDIGLRLYPYSKLKNAPYTVLEKEISISIKNIPPSYLIKNKADFHNWLAQFNA